MAAPKGPPQASTKFKYKAPNSSGELWLELGLDKPTKSLKQVREIQQHLSFWVVQAGEERWPHLRLGVADEGEVLAKYLENARTKWKQFDSLVQALVEAERFHILESEPTA